MPRRLSDVFPLVARITEFAADSSAIASVRAAIKRLRSLRTVGDFGSNAAQRSFALSVDFLVSVHGHTFVIVKRGGNGPRRG